MANAGGGKPMLMDQSKTIQLMFAANAFLSEGQHIEALDIYTEILTLHCPEHPHALLNRSLAYIVLSYPELAAADAFRAAVLAAHIGEEGWPHRDDIQEYLDLVCAAKKCGLPWAAGLMSQLAGDGMDASPCSISLEIYPDRRGKVSCYAFWSEVECKAKYRLALALWKCGDGAMADALDIIDSYLVVCPIDKGWDRDFRDLGNMIMMGISDLIHNEDSLKESLFRSGVLGQGPDGGDMFDMHGIRGLMRAGITMVKREVYQWNTRGRGLHMDVDRLNGMLAGYASKCRAAVVNEVEPGAAKMPTFGLYATQGILPGEQVLEEPSLLQAAVDITDLSERFFCNACAASIDLTTETASPLATKSTANGPTGEHPSDTARGNGGVSTRSHSTSARTSEELGSGMASGSAIPLTPDFAEQDSRGVAHTCSHYLPGRTAGGRGGDVASQGTSPSTSDSVGRGCESLASTRYLSAPVYTSEGQSSELPFGSVSVPSANSDEQLGEDLVSDLTSRTPAYSGKELGNCAPPENPPPTRDEVKSSRMYNTLLSTTLGTTRDSKGILSSKSGTPPEEEPDILHKESSRTDPHPTSAHPNEYEPTDVTQIPLDSWRFSSGERAPTPQLDELRPVSESAFCDHCHRAYFCSDECFKFAMGEYPYFKGGWGLDGCVGRQPVEDASNPHTIPDLIPTAHTRIYELLLARIFALAIQRGEHPLELDEVRFLSGGFFAAPRFASTFDSVDSDDGLAGDEEGPDHTRRRKTLPWSYNANIVRPFNLLSEMGLGIFHELERFDAWVINTLMAKIMTSTRFTKGGAGGTVVGSIHPFLSLASRGTSRWNCEIDGVEGGLYRDIIASQYPDPTTEDTTSSSIPSEKSPSIRAGEEIRLRTAGFQGGADACHGKSSSIEGWAKELQAQVPYGDREPLV
ncbi:MAG: hypothetical protein M1839_004978 [Geoglossum umbratile]|nr:MAG: hypothetical protein M1839_004978 [Geoglossum umbratile]